MQTTRDQIGAMIDALALASVEAPQELEPAPAD